MSDPHHVLDQSHQEEQAAEDVLITVKEYAVLHRLHVQTVYTAIRYGRLRYPVVRGTTGKRAAIRIAVPRFHVEA